MLFNLLIDATPLIKFLAFCQSLEPLVSLKIIGELFNAYVDILGTKSECVCFQLYGVDVAIDDQLKPSIMEVNKGPDLSAKDGRDREVKLGLSKDILKSVGLVPNLGNKFKTVLII